jgi:hypothetical protein
MRPHSYRVVRLVYSSFGYQVAPRPAGVRSRIVHKGRRPGLRAGPGRAPESPVSAALRRFVISLFGRNRSLCSYAQNSNLSVFGSLKYHNFGFGASFPYRVFGLFEKGQCLKTKYPNNGLPTSRKGSSIEKAVREEVFLVTAFSPLVSLYSRRTSDENSRGVLHSLWTRFDDG